MTGEQDDADDGDPDDSSADDDEGSAFDAGATRRDASASGGKDAGREAGNDLRDSSAPRDGSVSDDAGANEEVDSSPAPSADDCSGLPPVSDYAAKGPFPDAKMFSNIGPTGGYLMYRPDASLGKDGFKHPLAVWGNGIATTADQYQKFLTHVASHGFVVIACPDTMAERPCLDSGMTWLVAQNTAEGPLKGKLDTSREVTIGYSWGGGASIDTANRPNVKATVSIHGMPPRQGNAFTEMKGPLLLFTATGDTFVSASGYVTPNYDKSTKVPTFYATLQESVGHLYPIDEGAVSCAVEGVLGGPCAAAIKEQAPTVAFLRHFACGDQGAKKYFYGADCELCKEPWKSQNKPVDAWQ